LSLEELAELAHHRVAASVGHEPLVLRVLAQLDQAEEADVAVLAHRPVLRGEPRHVASHHLAHSWRRSRPFSSSRTSMTASAAARHIG
jgi:hypothetical protein